MKKGFMRLLSLLLVCVLLLGSMPAALAATVDDDPDLPEPIEGYDPNDPDNPYPYGVPVTDVVPEDILERINNGMQGISLMAADNQGNIPDEMWDNTILRALEYTGYDVQKQKDNGQLYEYRYIGSRLKTNDPDVLSDIGYWESGACPNGDETVDDPTTVTGKAPKISYFESNGLVCASFVTYYLCNYLPNIEGIDTSTVYEMAKQKGAGSNGAYYLTTVSLWKNTLDALSNQAGAGVTKYTSASTAYENLVPGDVIVFAKDSGSLAHVGIYAGAYDLYSYGSNLGEYHFMIHVGNSRGPEITIVEWMNSSGTSKDSSPIAWYHLDFNDMDEHGFIEVFKDDTDGAPLAGAYFTATDQTTGTNYIIGPTSSEGYAISEPLPLSTYLVKESVFPDGFQASGETSWTAVLTKDTPNLTYPIYAVNERITGDLGIKKDTEDGQNKAGWLFNIYTDQSCTTLLRENLESDGNGDLTVTGLIPGDVWVKEVGHKDPAINDLYQCASTNPQKVTIIGNQTVSVTFQNNLRYGSITFRKAITSGIGAELGWTANLWKIESDGTKTFIGSGTTKQDKNDPTYTFEGLLPGRYLLQEDPSSAKYGYSLDSTAYEVTVTAGQNTPVTITNESLGFIEILKETNTGKDVAGRKFNIFTDEALTQLLPGSPFESDSEGRFLTEAKPGVYYIQEVDESADNPGWIFDTTVRRVEVKAHETATVTFTNIQQGYGQIIKDMPDGGSGEGWEFDLHRASDNTYVATYTTGPDSTINTEWLLPGEYLVYEKISEDSLYYCESENPQRITIVAGEVTTVTFVNRLKPAKIEGLKTDSYGNPLPGSSFLLEWSEDGASWLPVTYTDSVYVTKGTCTSASLENGILTSGEDGIVSFTGLHPEMYYRMTEVSTVNGAQLMADTIFEGQIPTDDLAVAIEVVNNSVFVLPHTGSKSMVFMPVSIGLCLLICAGALLTLRKKEKSC